MSHTELQACPQLAAAMSHSLAAVHKVGVVHGDIALHNFVMAPTGTHVWLLDVEHSHLGNNEEQKLEMEQLEDLLRLALAGEDD